MFLSNSKGENGFSSKNTQMPVQEGVLEPGVHEKAVLGTTTAQDLTELTFSAVPH